MIDVLAKMILHSIVENMQNWRHLIALRVEEGLILGDLYGNNKFVDSKYVFEGVEVKAFYI